MTFKTEIFDAETFPAGAAAYIARQLPSSGSIVLTGGTTAARVYPELSGYGPEMSSLEVFFSDERCVPPDHEASNYGMVERTLLGPLGISRVQRMKGEDHPLAASHAYDKEIAGAVERGVGLLILGVGADAHIAALFPHSPALRKPEGLCMPVDRPDGFKGLTLTPEALLSARSVIFIVSGDGKSEAVERALTSTHDSFDCPVRLFAEHPDATFLLDAQAASRLTLE